MWVICLWLVDTLDSCVDHSLWKHCSSNTFSHTQKRFLVCVDWKTLCCAHQLTNKKEDAVSCWGWWFLFLELLLPAIVEYLSKRPKENTVFLRALIHSASFSWPFPMRLLGEWKRQDPSNSRKKRNKRNILKEKIFCKFNGLWHAFCCIVRVHGVFWYLPAVAVCYDNDERWMLLGVRQLQLWWEPSFDHWLENVVREKEFMPRKSSQFLFFST